MNRPNEKLVSKTVRLPASYVDVIDSLPGLTFTGKLLELINIALDHLDDQEPEQEVPFT